MAILVMLAGVVMWYLGKKGESAGVRVVGGLVLSLGIIWFVVELIISCGLVATG
ncbi:MAG: hypothetical protein WAW99_05680 [Candidatus Bipolaricaulis anaerobius]|jgi:hypothetical protein